MPRLMITKGPGTGQDHAVGTECVLGRSQEVDFILEDPLVSRRHARVFRDGPSYVIEDLASRNGTVVNGRKIQRHTLEDGDVVGIGSTQLSFRQKDMLAADASGGKTSQRQETPTAIAAPPPAATAPVAPAPAVAAPKAAAPAPAAAPVAAKPAPASAPAAGGKSIVAPVPSKKRRLS